MPVKRKTKPQKAPKEQRKGFFEMHKDILPQERTRVKTFIVEKPIIIHDKPQHINAADDEEQLYDSAKSRHKKKFRGVDLKDDTVAEEELGSDEAGDDVPADEDAVASEEFGAEGAIAGEGDDYADDGAEGAGALHGQPGAGHVRSHGMVLNVWWKKAILWAVFVWALILAFEIILWVAGLVGDINFTRVWWFFLGGLVVVSFVYFGFVESRLKI